MVVFSLTLVRHGETVANKDGVIQGHQNVALSDTGVTQARLVAFRLRNDRFTHIFASDLNRASQTAQIIGEGNVVSHVAAIQQDPRLRERGFGVFEGRTFKELFAAADKSNKKWTDFTPEGAETFREVRFRAKAFFRELCEKMAASSLSVENTHIPASVKKTKSSPADLKGGRTVDLSVKGGEDTKAESEAATPAPACSTSPQSVAGVVAPACSTSLQSVAGVVAPACSTSLQSVAGVVAPACSTSLQSVAGVVAPACSTSLQSVAGVVAPACSSSLQSVAGVVAAKRPRTEEPQLHRLSLEGVGPASDLDADCAFSQTQGAGATTTMARSNSSSSSGCSSLHDSVECPEVDVDLPTPTEEEERDTDSSDVGISRVQRDPASSPSPSGNVRSDSDCPGEQNDRPDRTWCSLAGGSPMNWLGGGLQPWVRDTDPLVISGSSVDPSAQTCPNVSLSPLLEHRLTSVSSVSSGRNSSFDEADIVPSVVGEVLVVSHGGLIKELLTHFMEELNCKIPGGKGHALRVCPNTGVSRFMVTLGEGDPRPAVTCLLIHDKEHLRTWHSLPEPCPAL